MTIGVLSESFDVFVDGGHGFALMTIGVLSKFDASSHKPVFCFMLMIIRASSKHVSEALNQMHVLYL